MASNTTPTHGRMGVICRARVNGFNGFGRNDLVWGQNATNAASAYYEVVIDSTGTPDTFKWRKNAGAWTSLVSITGAAQTLDEGQTIAFGSTTGHTPFDKWCIGNLQSEPCTVAGLSAQITDEASRLLRPDKPPIFTDSGGAHVLSIDYASGTAHFDAAPATVTCSGNLSYVPSPGIQKMGYAIGWTLDCQVEMADATPQQSSWAKSLPGMPKASATAEAYLIGITAFMRLLVSEANQEEPFFLVKFFTWDPDNDQTGDHFSCWTKISGVNVDAPLNTVIQEKINFEIYGLPGFVANV